MKLPRFVIRLRIILRSKVILRERLQAISRDFQISAASADVATDSDFLSEASVQRLTHVPARARSALSQARRSKGGKLIWQKKQEDPERQNVKTLWRVRRTFTLLSTILS